VATARFQLGRLIATPGALAALEESSEQPGTFISRHAAGYHRNVSQWHSDKLETMAPELKDYATRQTVYESERMPLNPLAYFKKARRISPPGPTLGLSNTFARQAQASPQTPRLQSRRGGDSNRGVARADATAAAEIMIQLASHRQERSFGCAQWCSLERSFRQDLATGEILHMGCPRRQTRHY
jgi:hypothetical protein